MLSFSDTVIKNNKRKSFLCEFCPIWDSLKNKGMDFEKIERNEANKMKETGKALNYIAKIRNKEKQRYAQAYYEYCENIRSDDPTLSSTYGCNYMAKQAVRLELALFGICEKNRPSASYWPQ